MTLATIGGVVAYIGLGSNLDDPSNHLNTARRDIAALDDVQELGFSSLYRSRPVGPQDQPDYLNAVMKIKTTLPARVLLHRLQAVENAHGRQRLQHWGPRTLDLDLLWYGGQIIDSADLIVPHPQIPHRAFVLHPWAELTDKEIAIPGLGTLGELLAACACDSLYRIDP